MKQVRKTYGHERGYSCTFRQWRAKSHCRFIHGYALSLELVFQCHDHEVDENGWVIDFGGLKPFKAWLDATFDHTTLVARDDPKYQHFLDLEADGLIQLIAVDRVGCEAVAEMVAKKVRQMLLSKELGLTAAKLVSVEVREHPSNGAIYVCQ